MYYFLALQWFVLGTQPHKEVSSFIIGYKKISVLLYYYYVLAHIHTMKCLCVNLKWIYHFAGHINTDCMPIIRQMILFNLKTQENHYRVFDIFRPKLKSRPYMFC